MQLKDPSGNIQQLNEVRNKKYKDRLILRIGQYHSKFNTHQRERFDKILDALSRKYALKKESSPLEMILARQIALNVIKIDDAETHLLENPGDRWISDIEKWLILMKKETRESIISLSTLVKVNTKKSKLRNFDDLRNELRDAENLPKTVTEVNPDGHDRRYHDDGVTRVEKT